jgi:ligand-binding sensor domain-containing protein
LYYTRNNLPQLPSNQIAACGTKLDDNTIWFGTQTGGAVSAEYGLAGLNWATYPLPIDSKINSIAFDLRNTVWFGTESGAWSFNVQTSRWTPFDSTASGTLLGSVHAVTTNRQNIRWFGTDAGLFRYNDTTWVTYTAANSPLPSDTVNALAYDYNQNLWIGTPNGAAVYNESGILY